MVACFTFITILCFILMQGTEYATTIDQLASGFKFEFYPEFAFLALAAYGYTGVNSGEIASYTYWCIEKGYPARIGPYQSSSEWVNRAGMAFCPSGRRMGNFTNFTTIPFYFLGAGVLHATGQHRLGRKL